jgi:vacuolar-type H+-ATPase subunit B/Vma2
MQDPKWDFWEQGERLPFEYVDKYSERFIKNRLTNDMILDYAMALGWDLRSDVFWTTDENAYSFEWKEW